MYWIKFKMGKISFSVIIPTLNEEKSLSLCINAIWAAQGDVEIIIVDGGSEDQTVSIASKENVIVCSSKAGRGVQLNIGAAMASGDVFLFLHADTQLPADAFRVLKKRFENPHVQIGTFAMCFDQRHWLLDFYAWMTKVDSLWTSFGDQGIVTRKSFFKMIGGFPNWPLFEDVRLLQEARKQTTIDTFPAYVTTSANRFVRKGIFLNQLKNGWLILQYLMGVSPEILYQKYYSISGKTEIGANSR